MKFCPNCGAPVDESASFCTNCGQKLTKPEAAQPTQASNNVNPAPTIQAVPNNNVAVASAKPKLSRNKIIIIVAAVIVVIAAFIGWNKYQSMPARNPNNPLSHQSFVIEKYPDNPVYSPSEENFGAVYKKVAILCYKKMGASNEDIKGLQEVSDRDWFNFYHTGEDVYAEQALNVNKSYKDRFVREFNQALYTNYLLKLVPERHLHTGQKIQVKLMLTKSFIKKYGIDSTPLQIKVSQIKHMDEDDE